MRFFRQNENSSQNEPLSCSRYHSASAFELLSRRIMHFDMRGETLSILYRRQFIASLEGKLYNTIGRVI